MAMNHATTALAGLLMAALVAGAAYSASPPATPRQLNADPTAYDGERVAVRGALLHDRCLYKSKARIAQWRRGFGSKAKDFDPSDFDGDGLTLIGRSNAPPGTAVTLKGVFKKDYLDGKTIDMKACGRNALILNAR